MCARTVLRHFVQDLPPAGGHTLPVRRIDEADGAVAEVHMGSAGPLFELHFDVVQRRVRHEHRTAQLQQHRRLDHLHVSPQMADPVAAVAEPSPARPLLHHHLHRFALRVGAALAQPVQHAPVHVPNIGLDVDALGNVQRQFVDCHDYDSLLLRDLIVT